VEPKTVISFDLAPRREDIAATPTILLTAFLSSLQGSAPGSVAAYKAAARHFLHWLEQQGVAVSALDDSVVRRFEKHGCSCQGFPLHEPNRPKFTSRVRRFVRFLEDQGFVELPDDLAALSVHLTDYATFLEEQQYGRVVLKSRASEARHFAAWLRVSRRSWTGVGADDVEQYARHHCRCPVYRKRGTLVGRAGPARRRRGAQCFVRFLQNRSVLPEAEREDNKDPRLLAYAQWLESHCGSTRATVQRFCGEIARCQLVLGEPSEIDAAAIRRLVSDRIKQNPGSSSLILTIVRSYVRFLIFRGECHPALLHAFPSVRRYRLASLPRYLDEAAIERIVTSCKADTAVEIRDKAIILLLARLGLRAGDVCQLRLADIDWITGSLLVSGKGRRPSRLPLPQDAGDAVLDYVERARPRVDEERLFLRTLAPFTPFRSSTEISGIISRVFDRGGIKDLPTGSHTFRHSLATRMLRAGAGLESVGTILRHRSPATTAIYAKVDIPMLLKVAQPWPGDLSC